MTLTRQSRDHYENNANTRRSELPIYQPYQVLRVYNGAVIVDLPDHIHVNKSFHTSLVRSWNNPIHNGQTVINSFEKRNVVGRVAERDDDGNIMDKWVFEKILDMHAEDIEKSGLTYLIKWKYDNEPNWQTQADLKGCEKVLREFHVKNPDKPGPPHELDMPLILEARRKPSLWRSKRLRHFKLKILK